MRPGSACSPSWALPKPTSLRFSSSTKTLKPRRCVAARLRSLSRHHVFDESSMSLTCYITFWDMCCTGSDWPSPASKVQPDLTCRKALILPPEPGSGDASIEGYLARNGVLSSIFLAVLYLCFFPLSSFSISTLPSTSLFGTLTFRSQIKPLSRKRFEHRPLFSTTRSILSRRNLSWVPRTR
jgi:hypothetical protein